MSEEGFPSPASRHDSRAGLPGSGGGKDGPPPPFAPAAQPLDDVTLSPAGSKRTLSPGREVARSSPFTGPGTPAHLGSGGVRRRSLPHRSRDDDETMGRQR